MQNPDDKEQSPDHGIEASSSDVRKSQSFIYPIRSLLGPIQQSGGGDILEALLSPSIQSTQTRLSEPGGGSYFPDVSVTPQQPAQVSKSAGGTPGTDEGFTFRHFPAEGADASFVTASPTISNLVEGTQAETSYPDSTSIPFQIQERRDPSDGHTTVIKEIEIQAPVPVVPTSGVARSLQESVSSSSSLPREGYTELSQTSSNNGDDEGGTKGSTRSGSASARPPSSTATSNQSFASAGLVHLPPVSSVETQKRTREWRGRLGSSNNASAPSSHGHSASSYPPIVEEEPEEEKNPGSVRSGSFSVVTRSSDKSGPMITMRFEHTEDENGHHVLVGREGRLTKCEDEPIRIPGAVQGFGVLLVVHEDNSTGQLKVRQASENSKVILGLSPKYLFNLDCFTGTLPSPQADLLWDNVQFLSDPDAEDEEDDEQNPQVFLLSGWGEPNSAIGETADPDKRRQWTCWVAAHRVKTVPQDPGIDGVTKGSTRRLLVLEFELESDTFNPLYPAPNTPSVSRSDGSSPFSGSGTGIGSNSTPTEQTERNYSTPGSDSTSTPVVPDPAVASDKVGDTIATRPAPGEVEKPQAQEWFPSAEAIIQSTTSRSRPLRSLERMRRFSRIGASLERTVATSGRGSVQGIGTMDVFTVLQEINEQLGKALDLLELLQIVVGVIKDLTQFHRVLCYQFDDTWNGQVVAELVDWNQTHDLYYGLHFPAADIPAQARQLYATNRVRILYDRGQTTARLVVKDRTDLEPPLDMTHCYLRAMSPIHLKYLGNMGVRASMSVSIIAFQKLWGLIACHSYGEHGMRVSFPVRQMLRLLSDSISRNVERLSYAQRLRTRKLISTVPTDQHPTGYIVSNSEDLLTLFDADCGVLVIGEGAKILGPNEHGQDILLLAEYLRVKQFTLLQVSQSVMQDYPDLQLPSGLDVIAGLLYVPLSMTGKDFIALLRKGKASDVNWAGRPPETQGTGKSLEPRTSFKIWTERLIGRCRAWTDEQLDTAAVLALVYGKFIEVWRQKESALQMNQMTTLLLSNASHEVRTPLHQIINYLELALDGKKLDEETRDNLTRSHAASKALLFTINDLLDLTRLEAGKETSFNEPFDLHSALYDAVRVYKVEATRRQIDFVIDLGDAPHFVVGDARKIKTVVANLTSNAVKYTTEGSVSVTAHTFEEPDGLRPLGNVAVEIVVSDTGCGIQPEKLESIFREFEQVDNVNQNKHSTSRPGLGLGLAVVARVVEQLGGQLRVDSKTGEGSRFSCLLPFPVADSNRQIDLRSSSAEDAAGSGTSNTSEIDSLVEALSASHMIPHTPGRQGPPTRRPRPRRVRPPSEGKFEVEDSYFPVRGVKVDGVEMDTATTSMRTLPRTGSVPRMKSKPLQSRIRNPLRILIVEDDLLNSRVLKKRLTTDGHEVETVVNGQQAVDLVRDDRDFDCILMDIQMPILDGFGATKGIRQLERERPLNRHPRRSAVLVGRIPIFAVSASLTVDQRGYMVEQGMDGWILKPIDFKRMTVILAGINNPFLRAELAYRDNCVWEYGGWLESPPQSVLEPSKDISRDTEPKSSPSTADPSPDTVVETN